jgi:nitroreductase
MEFDSVISKRKSVRSFKDKRVSWKDIIEAVDAACKGPFADGINNLKFLIIEEPEAIEKVAELSNQLWIAEAPVVVILCSDDSNLEEMHGDRGRVYSRQQAGAAIENFLLKVTDMGLSSCWVGSYTDELIKTTFQIPNHIQVEAVLPVGYEKGKAPQKKKKDLEHSLFWEKWGDRKRQTFVHESKDQFGFN